MFHFAKPEHDRHLLGAGGGDWWWGLVVGGWWWGLVVGAGGGGWWWGLVVGIVVICLVFLRLFWPPNCVPGVSMRPCIRIKFTLNNYDEMKKIQLHTRSANPWFEYATLITFMLHKKQKKILCLVTPSAGLILYNAVY